MADDPRRMDDLVQTVKSLRTQLDIVQATLLNRLATHTHSGGGGGGVSSVTAGDSTITIGGTSSAPTVAVNAIPESKVTNLVSDLAGKAPSSHTHAQSDITGLVNKLADMDSGDAARVATQQTTTSTTYTDLTTSGPSVSITLTAAKRVLVIVGSRLFQTGAVNRVYMSWAASGATTLAAADAQAVQHNGSGNEEQYSRAYYLDCAAGTTTFTAKYRAGGGTGQYTDREIAVVPI